MRNLIDIILVTGGGLGLFLLGMRHLSSGLQAASGEGLRRFMSLATGKKSAGVATGVVMTILVQSSSIVSVMLVGFVTSKLMTLSEAVSVLIGANVGTTFTVWLMAFAPSPEILGLGMIAIGMFMYFPFRQGKLHHFGLAILGLALVFLGMAAMKEGVMPIRESARLTAMLQSLEAKDLAHVALVAAISCLFTAVIQSSAASIVIFMTFASAGLITYETAISALFGANIGTTMTAWLAAIGAGPAAKRTALANTLMNVIGSIICLPFVLSVFVPLGRLIFPAAVSSADVMLPIAASDTAFSIIRGVIFLPFTGVLEKVLEKLVPQKEAEVPHLTSLNMLAKSSPAIACERAAFEVRFMAKTVSNMFTGLRTILTQGKNRDEEDKIFASEQLLDDLQRETTQFLGEILPRRMSAHYAALTADLIKTADEIESISDSQTSVLKAIKRIRAEGERLSGGDLAVILEIHDAIAELFTACTGDGEARIALANEVKMKIRAARELELRRVGGGSKTGAVLATLDMINAYWQIRGHALSLSFARDILA